MGIASLILGIISVLFALIPGCGLFLAPVPAIIGMGLGIAAWVGKNKRGETEGKGIAIAGTVISVLAFVVMGGWVGFMLSQKPEGMTFQEWMESQSAEIQEAVEEAEKEIEAQQSATEEALPAPQQ